jgi:fatty acid desaturase
MPAVARIDPKTVFSAGEWSRLTRRSVWRGPALVAAAWLVIASAVAMFIVFPSPLTYILSVMIIGARQLGLAILEHDAAHGALHPDPRINDWISDWFCGAPLGGSLRRYRPYHLAHHKYVEQPEDPDLSLSRPFPISPASFRRKIVRDLTGQTFFKQRIRPTLDRIAGKPRRPPRVADRPVMRFWIVNLLAIAALAPFGLVWVWPALWIAPMATWLPFITRLRNIAEHAVARATDDPFSHARTTLANPIERLLIAPFWVHFHAEHHVFMHVPCYRLEGLHRALMRKGLGERMHIARSYREVIGLAVPAEAQTTA